MRAVSLPLPRSAATQRIGVEHELCLWREDERVDFRQLITQLAGGIRPLDPGDPRARRLPSGVALTADGWEAELATPPVPIDATAPHRIDELLRSERTELRALSSSYGVTRVSGFSTHLNISVPDDRAVEIARAFVDHCLVALATVIEPASTHGLLVRPRRGRLEIGGEYVEGPNLVAGLTLLAGCVRGLLEGTTPACARPPEALAAREKFGWFVPPGGLHDADVLAEVWSWAGPWARREGLDLEPVDALVDGVRPLRHRRWLDPSRCSFGNDAAWSENLSSGPRELRDGIHAETEWLTWQHAVWLFRDSEGRECRAVVPADRERDFLDGLDSGRLDPVLSRMLRRRLLRRRLLVNAQIDDGGLWHDVRPGALVPAERQADGSVPRVSVGAARRAHLRAQRTGSS
jgi:hypothetical protein